MISLQLLSFLAAQLLLVVFLAPLITGCIKAWKAFWQNRQGPTLLQSWYDILKYLSRESVVSENASWVYRGAPVVYIGAMATAACLTPTILVFSPLGAYGDAITIVGLLATARFALTLAALDTGSNFGGMGVSRELMFAALIEPALLTGLFALAAIAGTTNLQALAEGAKLDFAHLLAFGSLFIVAIAETGRVPVDNPDTHLELTMVHEGMLLEYSGRPLGLLILGSHLKQLTVLSLLAAFFFPWGIAHEISGAALIVGLGAYLVKVVLLGLALGLVETLYAKRRIFRVPELLGMASALGIIAIVAGLGARVL